MKTMLHASKDRGTADFGWLKSWHSFSFGSYFDVAKMGFGALRVLNDDVVAPGKGFDTHGHKDMEIVSIPLRGSLAHKDSAGNEKTITEGEVQIMSAGTGITHSEYNPSQSKEVNFLQIWIHPKTTGLKPSYQQTAIDPQRYDGTWFEFIGPDSTTGLTVNQSAKFFRARLRAGAVTNFPEPESGMGIYFFNLAGAITVNQVELGPKDALGVSEIQKIEVAANEDSDILAIQVPL